MNKITYIAIGAIWAVLFAVVGLGIWMSPDVDVLASLQKYKIVGQDYLDRKDIVPSELKRSAPDDEFVYVYAQYLDKFQEAENDYNAAHQLLKVALQTRSLKGAKTLEAAYTRAAELKNANIASYEKMATAQAKLANDYNSIDTSEMKLFGEYIPFALERLELDEIPFRDEVTRSRLALDKYYSAILEFLAKKNGSYSIEGVSIYFTTSEDQTYYDELNSGMKGFQKKLRKAFADYQNDLREYNSKIPVDIK